MLYVGLDIHKRTISYCVRQPDGTILLEGCVPALREKLDELATEVPVPCIIGMEATLFTAWVYDHFTSKGIPVKVAHPSMLKAIFAGKRKNDEIDAQKLADLLRCNYFPECHMASREVRERRRALRYRNMLVRQSTQTKNKMAGMLMEAGIPYNKSRLHNSKKYFEELLESQAHTMPDALPGLLRLGRNVIDVLRSMNRQLVHMLENDAVLAERVARLTTIPGGGVILALTWALEIGNVARFPSQKSVISYCGLCGAEQSSAGKSQRMPISKQRNKHLQTTLIEAAKVAPRWHTEFALLYDREAKGQSQPRHARYRTEAGFLFVSDRPGRPSVPASAARPDKVAAEFRLGCAKNLWPDVRCRASPIRGLDDGAMQLPRSPLIVSGPAA
jgi:transposase